MLIASFPAGPWETNCYVVATGTGADCVIIDPGHQAADQVAAVVGEHRLTPAAVLATHGHLDHVFAVAPICSTYAVPVWIHPDDRHLLTDPVAGLGPDAVPLITRLTGRADAGLVEPDDVRLLADGAVVDVAGLSFTVTHAPGHTAGSVIFTSPYDHAGPGELSSVAFTGDVVFAGAIGRTDLPGGDDTAMRMSLRTRVLTMDDRTALLPGHGPQTTMARERTANPYLQVSALTTPTDCTDQPDRLH